MNTKEMALALNALSEISIRLDVNDQWYVSQSVDIKDDNESQILRGVCGRGDNTIDAIDNHWRALTATIPNAGFIVVHAMDDKKRRHVRWNGFMWKELS